MDESRAATPAGRLGAQMAVYAVRFVGLVDQQVALAPSTWAETSLGRVTSSRFAALLASVIDTVPSLVAVVGLKSFNQTTCYAIEALVHAVVALGGDATAAEADSLPESVRASVPVVLKRLSLLCKAVKKKAAAVGSRRVRTTAPWQMEDRLVRAIGPALEDFARACVGKQCVLVVRLLLDYAVRLHTSVRCRPLLLDAVAVAVASLPPGAKRSVEAVVSDIEALVEAEETLEADLLASAMGVLRAVFAGAPPAVQDQILGFTADLLGSIEAEAEAGDGDDGPWDVAVLDLSFSSDDRGLVAAETGPVDSNNDRSAAGNDSNGTATPLRVPLLHLLDNDIRPPPDDGGHALFERSDTPTGTATGSRSIFDHSTGGSAGGGGVGASTGTAFGTAATGDANHRPATGAWDLSGDHFSELAAVVTEFCRSLALGGRTATAFEEARARMAGSEAADRLSMAASSSVLDGLL